MNVLHIAVLFISVDDNPDLIKLLLHYGVDHQVCCFYDEVRSYINIIIYASNNIYIFDIQMTCTPYQLADIQKRYQIKDVLVITYIYL
jgi:uncharacterized membrane protein (UPF0127 family)